MNRVNPKVDGYLRRAKQGQEEFEKLRMIILEGGLTEELKCGRPCYTFQKRNIVLIVDSKNTGGRLGKRSIEVIMKTVVMTMNVAGLTHQEFRAILDEPGIYQHLSHPTETGMRIIEVWESQEGFEEFAERRLKPAVTRLDIQRDTTIVFEPFHNFFGPRLSELPGLVGQLPGGPNT